MNLLSIFVPPSVTCCRIDLNVPFKSVSQLPSVQVLSSGRERKFHTHLKQHAVL
jgi:hypothetical protein